MNIWSLLIRQATQQNCTDAANLCLIHNQFFFYYAENVLKTHEYMQEYTLSA